jgi:glucose-1-phosphate cytidylyltransferase
MTGGRLKRVQKYVGNETFCFTYGDGLSDVNVAKVIEFHRSQGKIATITASRHQSRFGILTLDGQKVTAFAEKPTEDEAFLNSGFFVFEPEIFSLIDGDETVFEKSPMERLVAQGELVAYKHDGFFMGMDSLRERNILENLWHEGKAPWKVW